MSIKLTFKNCENLKIIFCKIKIAKKISTMQYKGEYTVYEHNSLWKLQVRKPVIQQVFYMS